MADLLTGIEFDGNYRNWISEISSRFKASQIKASIKVNDEMLRFYWILGRDIEIAHQIDAQIFINEITPQVGAQIDKNIVFMIGRVKQLQILNLHFLMLEVNWPRKLPKIHIILIL